MKKNENTTVTLIDDDEEFLEELREVLSAGGYDPVAINDPRIAVKALATRKPDVLLIDLNMPNKNGFELSDEIQRLFSDDPIPMIAMSAYFKEDFTPLLKFCGIKRCLKKPFNPLDVISEIEEVINEKESGTWRK